MGSLSKKRLKPCPARRKPRNSGAPLVSQALGRERRAREESRDDDCGSWGVMTIPDPSPPSTMRIPGFCRAREYARKTPMVANTGRIPTKMITTTGQPRPGKRK